jgi:hypothetical protein
MDETDVVAAAASPDAHSKILFFLEQFWSFVTVSVGVALGGVAAKRVVAVLVPAEVAIARAENGARTTAASIAIDPKLPLWYRLWRATISTHPVIVGGLCGLAPIPVANWVPEHTAAHMLWFALAGALSGQIFEIGNRLKEIGLAVVRQRLGVRSEPPSPATPASEPKALAEELEPDDHDVKR